MASPEFREWLISSYQMAGKSSEDIRSEIGKELLGRDSLSETGGVYHRPAWKFINKRFGSNLSHLGTKGEVYVVLDGDVLFSYGVAHVDHVDRPNPHVFYVVAEHDKLKPVLESLVNPNNLSKFVAETFDWLNECKHLGDPFANIDFVKLNKEAEAIDARGEDGLAWYNQQFAAIEKRYEQEHGKDRHEQNLFTHMAQLHVLDTSTKTGATFSFDGKSFTPGVGYPTLRD